MHLSFLSCVCIGGGRVPGSLHFSHAPRRRQCCWSGSVLSVDDVETKGRRQSLHRSGMKGPWSLLALASWEQPGLDCQAGDWQVAHRVENHPQVCELPASSGAAPGSSPPQHVAIWPSCQGRALLQTEFPEPTLSSLFWKLVRCVSFSSCLVMAVVGFSPQLAWPVACCPAPGSFLRWRHWWA